MDFVFTSEQEQLRQEVRQFLEQELAAGTYQRDDDSWAKGFSPEFSRKVGAKGWIGVTWPKAYGGQGRSYLDRLIVTEELLRYGAPVAAHWTGDRQIGPSIIAHGNEEQKKFFLPRIVQGEFVFALGMSEPGAGSDLASLQTKAVADGDDYIINGQKVWTSGAHYSDWCYLVARTDPQAPKHRGISEFLIDMKLPGITVRPLIDMTGGHHYNEVYFDSVRVPKTTLIGEKNRGWYQIAGQLDYERSGIERLMSNYPLYKDVLKLGRTGPRAHEPWVRHALAEISIAFHVGRLLIYRVAWLLTQGKVPNYEAAMAKAYGCEYEQRLANLATLFFGLWGQLAPGSKGAPLQGRPTKAYLYAPAYTIQGGTSEILRNIVALRGLGLPAA